MNPLSLWAKPARLLRTSLWALLGVFIACQSASAQSQEEPPPRYRVEVIVFSQPALDLADRAQSMTKPPLPLPGRAWPLRDSERAGFGYAQIDPAQHQLAQTAQRIDAQPGFRVFWHAAWEQPGLPESESQAVALPWALRREGLTGRVQVNLARFLHTQIDLHYTQASADEASPPQYWALSDSLRMRSEEQHYLDHPVLGVIVRIDPLDP